MTRTLRLAFTFWAFPAENWVKNLNAYLSFANDHFHSTGFRCNMPLGSYYIRRDQNALLSYSYDGDIFSIDPIHAFSDVDQADWEHFVSQFNQWASARGGLPLINQSPFITQSQVRTAYGSRWQEFSSWVQQVDP